MQKNKYKKVLLVDNQPIYSLGLSVLLEKTKKFIISGIAGNIKDALKIAEKEKPDLVILEIRLGNENGLDLITKLKLHNPDIAILVISVNNEIFYSERVLRSGARGFIMKTSEIEIIHKAVNTVLEGKVFLSESEKDRIFQAITTDNAKGKKDVVTSMQKLSNRELQVFSLIGKGYGTIEIASLFNISIKTIDSHKEHIKLKLHCGTSQELRQLAIEWSNNL